jgi:putative membrane protein
MRHLFVSSVLTLLALPPAIAQSTEESNTPTLGIGNPGFAAPGTKEQAPGVPAPNQPNVPDQVFVIRATLGGAAEIELARLAEQQTRNDAVREFARQMFRDHSRADNTLSRLAERDGISVPEELDAKHQHVLEGLSRLSGPEFDIEYLRVQVQNHQRMAQLMEYVIGSGEDAQVQAFAAASLPKVFVHLAMARELLEEVSRQNPQVAAAPPHAVSGMPTPQTPRPLSN